MCYVIQSKFETMLLAPASVREQGNKNVRNSPKYKHFWRTFSGKMGNDNQKMYDEFHWESGSSESALKSGESRDLSFTRR